MEDPRRRGEGVGGVGGVSWAWVVDWRVGRGGLLQGRRARGCPPSPPSPAVHVTGQAGWTEVNTGGYWEETKWTKQNKTRTERRSDFTFLNFSARIRERWKAHQTLRSWLHVIGHQVFRAYWRGEGRVDVLLRAGGGRPGRWRLIRSLTVLWWSGRVASGVEPRQAGGGGVWLGTPQGRSLPHWVQWRVEGGSYLTFPAWKNTSQLWWQCFAEICLMLGVSTITSTKWQSPNLVSASSLIRRYRYCHFQTPHQHHHSVAKLGE